MIQNLAQESTIVWHKTSEITEQPVIISDYKGSECISLEGPNGSVTIPYDMINEVVKVMKAYKK